MNLGFEEETREAIRAVRASTYHPHTHTSLPAPSIRLLFYLRSPSIAFSQVHASTLQASSEEEQRAYMLSNPDELWACATQVTSTITLTQTRTPAVILALTLSSSLMQIWFHAVTKACSRGTHCGLHTRHQLRERMPQLCEWLQHAYGDGTWRFAEDRETCPHAHAWQH